MNLFTVFVESTGDEFVHCIDYVVSRYDSSYGRELVALGLRLRRKADVDGCSYAVQT